MDQPSGREDVFSLFDTSPSSFLWSPQRVALVQAGRQPTGSLFFDDLISIAGVDGSLYPPQDILSLRRLLQAIQASSFDKLKKDCLVYYLLKDVQEGGVNGQATRFAEERLIPSQFVDLTDGYWAMDNGLYELAVSRLSSISVKPDFTSKILITLSLIPSTSTQLANPNVTSDSLSARLVLHFIRFARPPLESPQDVHIKLDALAKTTIREAWMYMRTFEEGEFRAGLIRRVFQFCLSPKPKPTPLQTLLAFPFTPFEDQTLSSLCLAPPTSPPLSTPSLTVLFDLANVRLVSQGRFAEAIKLDRAIGAKGQAAEKRRATILGLVRLLPEVQRRILELEMDEGGDDVEKAGMVFDGGSKKGKGEEAVVNGTGGDEDVEMAGGLPASTSNGSASSHMSISTSNHNLPLSASQVLRTSSPQLAIHRAFIAPPSSPGPSSSPRPNQQQPSTPGRVGQQSTATAFAFQAPTSISSHRPLPFGDLNKSLFASKPSSPAPSFGRPQSPFAPSASSRPVDAGSPAARGFAQQQPSSSSQHPALASSQNQREASPFAQAARQASALQRSTATPRGGARLGASTSGGTFRSVSQQQQQQQPPIASSSSVRSRRREVEDEEEEDRQSRETTPKKKHRDHHAPSSSSRHRDVDMDDEEQPRSGRREEEDLTISQLDHNPRRQQPSSSSRTSTKKQPPPSTSTRSTATTTTSSRRKLASSTKSAPTPIPEVEASIASSPPPAAAPKQPTRASHRRTASQVSNAPPPAPTRASSRLATATTSTTSAPATTRTTTTTRKKVVPGAFHQEVDEEEEHADVVSSPPPPKRAAGAGRPNTRAASVVSDAGGDEEETGGGRGKRTTRGSVRGTASPEQKVGVRRSTRRG